MPKLIKQVKTLQQYGFNFDNGEVETSTTLYNLYKNTAQPTPVNGTGGSPSYLVKSLDTTAPIIGKGSLLISKSANNAQGEGLSLDFSIDRGQVTSTAQISFTYETSANYVDNDIGVYIYDKTNAILLYPSIVNLPATYGKPSNHLITFIPSTSNNYRLIFHVQSTSALAYTFGLDNIEIGNKSVEIGAAIGADRQWTPTTVLTNVPGSWTSAYWNRDGTKFYFKGTYTLSGAITGTASILIATLLAELGLTNKELIESNIKYYDNGIGYYLGSWTGSSFYNSSGTVVNATSPFTWASGDIIYFSFSCYINQWTSNVNLTSDFSEYASNDGSGGTAAGTTYNTGMKYGPEGSFIPSVVSNSTSAIQTEYRVDFKNPIQATDKIYIEVLYAGDNQWRNVEELFPRSFQSTTRYGLYRGLTAGGANYIYVAFGNGGSFASGTTYGSVSLSAWSTYSTSKWRVRKVSNGNMAEVPPTVFAAASGSASVTADTPINISTVSEDTHNALTTGAAWKFTAPISGLYSMTLRGATSGTTHIITLYKNGILMVSMGTVITGSNQYSMTRVFRANAGDYFDVRPSVSSSGTSYSMTIVRLGS